MTRQTRGILALVLVCFGLLAIAGVSQSNYFKYYQQDLNYYNRKCDVERQSVEGEYKKDCQRFLYRAVDDPITIFTAILTLATIGLFAVTYFLWRATRDLVKGADDTADRQLRPYLLISDATFEQNTPLFIGRKIKLTNFGNTPAFDVSATLQTEFGERDIEPAICQDTPIYIHGIVAPTQSFFLDDSMPFHTETGQLERINFGSHALYVYGIVKYNDSFGRPHETTYRYISSEVPGEAKAGVLWACRDGNSAT